MSDKEIKKVEDQLNGYKNDLNKGGSFDDVIASYKKSSGSGTDSSVSKVEVLDKSSIGDELKEAIGKLKTGKAETLKVGSGDSAIYYLVYKKDVSKDVDSYIGNESNRAGVLASMKSDEFQSTLTVLQRNSSMKKTLRLLTSISLNSSSLRLSLQHRRQQHRHPIKAQNN